MTGERRVLGIAVMLAGDIGRRIVFGAVHDARLHGIDELVETHGDAVAAERIHGVDEDRVAHHADLEAFQVLHRPDRPFAVVYVAAAGIIQHRPIRPAVG